jgi:hypothetical protein
MLCATIAGGMASSPSGASAPTPGALHGQNAFHGQRSTRTPTHAPALPSARTLAVTTFTPPSSISDTCATDVTAPLNFWIASLPLGATVDLPHGACYLVSNSPTSLLIIHNKAALTINGDGTTFEQNNYDSAGDPQSPVLTIGHNFDVIVNDVTFKGSSSHGGYNDEGNSGVLMWQNYGVTLERDVITNVEGDGLDVYPLHNQSGVNWYVTVDHSIIYNIGYKAMVPEAADHFIIENSLLESDDIDAEVDFNCKGNLPNCGTSANPAIGVQNMQIEHNFFPNGLALEDGMSCMPVGNWTISDNNFGTGSLVAQFDTAFTLTLSALQSCGRYSGLTIEGNTSTGARQPCCGGGSSYILLQGWTNVTIANNHFVYDLKTGLIGGPIVDLWGDTNVSITNNAFVNFYNVTRSTPPAGWPATTGVTVCGNTTGSVQYPMVGAPCP